MNPQWRKSESPMAKEYVPNGIEVCPLWRKTTSLIEFYQAHNRVSKKAFFPKIFESCHFFPCFILFFSSFILILPVRNAKITNLFTKNKSN